MHQKRNKWRTHRAAAKQSISHPAIWTVTQQVISSTSRPVTSNISRPVTSSTIRPATLNTRVPVTAGTNVPLTPNTSPSTSCRTKKMNVSSLQRWVHTNRIIHVKCIRSDWNVSQHPSKTFRTDFFSLRITGMIPVQTRPAGTSFLWRMAVHTHQPWAVELS